MSGSLFDYIRDKFQAVMDQPEGREHLKAFDVVIQFNITDGESFHINIRDGAPEFIKGMTPETSSLKIHHVKGTDQQIRNILDRKIRLIDAMWEGQVQTVMDTRRNWWFSHLTKLANYEKELF